MLFRVNGRLYRWNLWECFTNLFTIFAIAGAIASLYFAFVVCQPWG